MKKVRKQKWKSAEHKRQSEELAASWEKLKARHMSPVLATTTVKPKPLPQQVIRRDSHKHLPSIDSGVKGAVTTKKPMIYTGTAMVGIGTLHKSNAVPVFSEQEAKEISAMRR